MKRSPSSSCSSSSSCVDSSNLHQSDNKPKSKRVRPKKKNPNPDKCRRSSIYRGVTRHRWTGRFEAHLWDKSSWNSIQNKKGRQIYLGAYDNEEAAAHTYDLAALKYWGVDTILNFPIETYTKEHEEMQKMSKEEYLASLRRQSSGFSRGVSKYRGVARHHHNGKWEARIGRVFGNKYLYLGTYSTQEEAAVAYDMAAIEYRGPNAVTNFDISSYAGCLKIKKTPLLPHDDDDDDDDGHVDHDKPQPPPKCPNFSTKLENGVHEQQPQQEEEDNHQEDDGGGDGLHQQPPPMDSTKMESSAMAVMDSNIANEHEHDHPWSLCLDTSTTGVLFNPLVGEELPPNYLFDMLDDSLCLGGEFVDNIDSIFDGPTINIESNNFDYFNPDSLFEEEEEEEEEEEKGNQVSAASPPPPSSSTSSSSSMTTT